MSEILCPLCNAQSPEHALFCQHCGQPLKCQECGANLLPTARACIKCGKLIPQRTNNDQFQIGTSVVPPGYNRLKFHETYEADVRELDVTVSDQAITQIGGYIGDLIPSLMGTRLKGHTTSSANYQQQKQPDVVEVPSDLPSPKPQLLPAASRQSLPKNSPEELIWEIFTKEDGGELRLDITNLKATSKRDHTLRLVYLYLYSKGQLGEKNVPRNDVYGFLDHVGIKDTNTSSYISKAHGIGSEGGMFRLTFEGRKQAEQYIADIFNDELTGGWLTSSGSKKPSKKSAEQPSSTDASVASWISHATTKELSEAIDHSVRVQLPLVDKALLALYGIHKSGYAEEVPLASIKAYLYGAFDVPVSSNALSNTLHRLRTEKSAKSSYINFRPNRGYKSTPSGRKYIEDTLLKQPQLTPIDQNAGSNGATQP